MQKPSDCSNCILESFTTKQGHILNLGRGFSIPDGRGTSGVVIIGESLGHDEVIDGMPFRPHAQAGSKLEQCFKLAGVNRNQFLLWNVLACQPPNNEIAGTWYGDKAIEHCSRHFRRVVGGFSTPKVRTILALGNIPLVYLTGVSGIAKEKQSISYLRGYVFKSGYGLVVPSYHPSYVKRGNHRHTPVLVSDLQKAMEVANGTYTSFDAHSSYMKPDYIEYPSLDEANSFLNQVKYNKGKLLAYDIENPKEEGLIDEDEMDRFESPIVSIQFSLGKGTGINFPWDGKYRSIAEQILASENVKVGHNAWLYDNKRLKLDGVEVKGKVLDSMWMFKMLHPGYDRHLQAVASLFDFPFPWKHLFGSKFEFYGCADVDCLHWIVPRLIKLMKDRGVWKGYIEQVHRIHPIMSRAASRGIPISKEKHQKLEGGLKGVMKGIYGELQELVPDELKNITPKRKVG